MTSRSICGLISKNGKSSSTSSRCCPVSNTRQRAQGLASRALITGAILMASGRVPITQTMVFWGARPIKAASRACGVVDRDDATDHAGTEKRRQAERAFRASRSAGSAHGLG